jgi:hypothetical protein
MYGNVGADLLNGWIFSGVSRVLMQTYFLIRIICLKADSNAKPF